MNGAESIGDRVQAAATRTSAAGSARLSFGLFFGASALEEHDRLGVGIVDFAARLVQASQPLMPGAAVQEAMQNAPEALTRPREMIHDGPATLMRTGESWVAFGELDRDGPLHHGDPLWPLDALFGAGGDIIEVGTDAIRDVRTTHYRLTVDLTVADELLPAGIGVPEGSLRELRRQPTEVWLDDAGLARRIAMQNIAGDRELWQVIQFWDFGIPATITPPDPSEISLLDPGDMGRIFMEND